MAARYFLLETNNMHGSYLFIMIMLETLFGQEISFFKEA